MIRKRRCQLHDEEDDVQCLTRRDRMRTRDKLPLLWGLPSRGTVIGPLMALALCGTCGDMIII